MIADEQVRDTIARTGLDRTLFVEAGAGTGKTTQLVDRIVNLVIDRGVPLARIAAITFTDAAAAELRDRIRTTFERRLTAATNETDDTVASKITSERCRVALAEADLAAISTLHGFAHRILSEHPAWSGLPPRIGVLDEVSSTLEREERWERFVDSLHDDPANEELLVRASLLGLVIDPSYDGQASIKDVATVLGQSWDRLSGPASVEHPPLPPLDFGPLDAAVDALDGLTDRCDDQDDRFYRHLVDELLPSMSLIRAIADPHDKLRALSEISEWKTGRGGKAGAWGGDVASAKAPIVEVDQARERVIADACHEVLSRLVTLVARDQLDAAATRRIAGRLEFHDLLVFAEQLLTASAVARSALHDRYTHLLLDEFQDTDPIQVRLAVLIAASIEGDVPDDWRQVAIEAGRLFFVGDPKQSIYRFRRADITLFLAARDRFGGDDGLQRLTTNFRTVEPVIDWINHTFAGLMPTEVPGMQAAYEPLHAHRPASHAVDHRPVLLGHPHHQTRAAEVRAAEAAEVAEALVSVGSEPHRWLVHDEITGEWRPATLADVTVLIPTRTELPALLAALDEARLPYHLATGNLVYESQEVRDALAALAAIDDPGDQLALVAALRSSLYGASDVDLFEYHAAGGRWDLRRDPPADLPTDHPVVEAIAHLRSLWDERWWVQPSVLLARLLDERRATLVAFGNDDPDESWARHRFLLDQARQFESSSNGGLRPFLQWAELQRSETVTAHQPVAGDGGGAVSIMTIHGAKGLEFPITVLSGLSAKPRPSVQGASVIWSADGFPLVRLRKGRAMHGHGDLTDTERDMDRHEQLRLLYVACTRARDHLVVSCHHQEGNGSFGARLWELAQQHPDTWQRLAPAGARAVPSAPPVTVPAVDPDRRAGWIRSRTELLATAAIPKVVSATGVARAADEPDELDPGDEALTNDMPGDDTEPGGSRPVIPFRRGRAGTAIGRAVHATLQLVDLDAAADTVYVEATRQAHLEAIPELASQVGAMAKSALGAAAVRLPGVAHRELYVAAPVGDRILEGYVDLLIEGPDGLVVVDYKTDTVRTEADVDAKLATYEMQAGAYAVALEAATGLPVTACWFVFCHPDGAIERQVTDLAGVTERVRRALG